MIATVLNRIVVAPLTLLGVGVIVFILLRVAPGDPIAMMIAPGASPADVAALRARYGLDAPILTQFVIWLKGILGGDFGTSISLRRNVLGLLAERLPATLELAFAALIVAVILGTAWAIAATLMRRRAGEAVLDGINGVLLAIPDFVWALALVLLLGVLVPVFPLSGRLDPSVEVHFVTGFYLLESLLTLSFGVARDIAATWSCRCWRCRCRSRRLSRGC